MQSSPQNILPKGTSPQNTSQQGTSPQSISLQGRKWQEKLIDYDFANYLIRQHNITEFLAKFLSANINKDEALADESIITNFLNPKIKNLLPDPFLLLDMDLAINFTIETINKKKKIAIFADYDVDGATSAAIMHQFFTAINTEITIYVPDRISEGYGPNSEALIKLKGQGVDLVITVDCGTTAFEPLQKAKDAGLDIIVIDHHIGATNKPNAIAVINPNRLDETFPVKNICAATVCFLFLVALNQKLRNCDFYNQNQLESPNLMAMLDLVALGTVCDVMPLTGLNRAIVSSGLKIINQKNNLGIKSLIEIAKAQEKITSYHLGFIIGPRINAGGRIGDSNLGAKLLTCKKPAEAEQIATLLDTHNQQRKELENIALQEAIAIIENSTDFLNNSNSNNIIFVASQNWHQGIIGIIASRLKDKYNKPTAVMSIDEEGKYAKASCRSIDGVDFGKAIIMAKDQDILISGGGHKMAGGYTVSTENMTALQDFFNNIMQQDIIKARAKDYHEYSFAIETSLVNHCLIEDLATLEPFGTANQNPLIRFRNLTLIKAMPIGKELQHLSIIVSSKSNIGLGGVISAIYFNVPEEILDYFINNKNCQFDLIGSLKMNYWQGNEKLQIIAEDVIKN